MRKLQITQLAAMNMHYSRYSIDAFLDSAARLGFTQLELWGGAPHFFYPTQCGPSAAALRRMAADRGPDDRLRDAGTMYLPLQYRFGAGRLPPGERGLFLRLDPPDRRAGGAEKCFAAPAGDCWISRWNKRGAMRWIRWRR